MLKLAIKYSIFVAQKGACLFLQDLVSPPVRLSFGQTWADLHSLWFGPFCKNNNKMVYPGLSMVLVDPQE